MFIDRWMGQEDVVYVCNRILLSHKNEWNWVICSDVDGPNKVCHNSEVSQKEKKILYTNAYTLKILYTLCIMHNIWMWELDYKVSWVLKNWCFWTMVLEKTLESLLDYKEIKSVSPKGNQSWICIGRTDAEAEAPILWPPDAMNWLI